MWHSTSFMFFRLYLIWTVGYCRADILIEISCQYFKAAVSVLLLVQGHIEVAVSVIRLIDTVAERDQDEKHRNTLLTSKAELTIWMSASL